MSFQVGTFDHQCFGLRILNEQRLQFSREYVLVAQPLPSIVIRFGRADTSTSRCITPKINLLLHILNLGANKSLVARKR